MNKHSDTFCVNPWITLHHRSDAGLSPCCLWRGRNYQGSVAAYTQSDMLLETKKQLMDNVQIESCSNCWEQESQGITSKRIRDNKTYDSAWHLLHSKNPLQPNDKFVEYYLRLGNHCNLRCTTCVDRLSTGWISENKKFGQPTKSPWLIDQDDPIWQHIKDNTKWVRAIEFIGGEPFMMLIDKQQDLLAYLADNNYSNKITIKYNTNGTRFPYDLIQYWKSFKKIEVNVRVDGVGDQFHYLRYPGTWSEIYENLKAYRDLVKQLPNLELTLVCTISVFNLGYIQRMIDLESDIGIKIFFNLLSGPEIFSVSKAPRPVRNWILDQIKYVDKLEIKSIADSLAKVDHDVDISSYFLDRCKVLDQRRGLSLEKTFPEIYKLMTNQLLIQHKSC